MGCEAQLAEKIYKQGDLNT